MSEVESLDDVQDVSFIHGCQSELQNADAWNLRTERAALGGECPLQTFQWETVCLQLAPCAVGNLLLMGR